MQASFYAFPLAIVCVLSTTFNCSQPFNCSNQSLACDDGEDCYIYCTGDDTCKGTTFKCADGHDCYIYCTGYSSCCALAPGEYTTFKCPMSTSVSVNVSCTVVCGEGTSASLFNTCQRITVNAQYSDLLSLTNYGYGYEYFITLYINVTCPCEGKCYIDCGSTVQGCASMTVNVQKSELNMVSTGINAYYLTTVRGEYASKLTMTGNGSWAFVGTNIYCPHTEEGPIKCNLKYSGHHSGFEGTQIMAIDSFSDISMICDSFSETEDCYKEDWPPIMHCLPDYSESCNMTTDDGINWSCMDTTSVCAVAQIGQHSLETFECEHPTRSPTPSPTQSPTESSQNAAISITLAVFALFIIILALLYWSRKRKQNKNILGKNKQNYYHSIEIAGVKEKHDIFVEKKMDNENDSLPAIGNQINLK